MGLVVNFIDNAFTLQSQFELEVCYGTSVAEKWALQATLRSR